MRSWRLRYAIEHIPEFAAPGIRSVIGNARLALDLSHRRLRWLIER
jgi:hypothetical protein